MRIASEVVEVLERVTDGFCALDAGWRFTYVNAAAQAALRRPADSLIGKSVWLAFPKLQGTVTERECRRAVAERRHVEFEDYCRSLDLRVRVHAHPRTDGLWIHFHDIGPVRRVGAAREGKVEMFDAVFDLALVGMALATPDGRLQQVNARFCEILGYSRQELEGVRFHEIAHPEERPAVEEEFARALRGEAQGFSGERRYLHKDRKTVWVSLACSLHRSPNGTPHRLIVVIEDVTDRKLAQIQLEERETQLRLAMQVAAIGYWVWNLKSNTVTSSPELGRIFGWDSDGVDWERYFNTVHPDDRRYIRRLRRLASVAEGPDEEQVDYRIVRPDGEVRWVRSARRLVRDEHGEPIRLLGFVQDVTEHRRAEAALEEERERLQLAVAVAQIGFWEWDLKTRAVYLSPIWKKQLGYAEEELPSRFEEWQARLHPEDRKRAQAMFKRFLRNPDQELEFEFRVRHKDGRYRWMLARAVGVKNGAGRAAKIIGTHFDITERKQSEQRVREAALHDLLTGLPSRELIFEYASHLIAGARRTHSHVALLFIDLDRFKPINDIYGHEVGDRLLQEVAKRLRSSVRQEDVVGRLGGDEFVVLLPHVEAQTHAGIVATHIIDTVGRPYHVDTLELSVSPSIGISVFPGDGPNVSTLLRAADLAMYQAKQAGRNTYHFYTADLEADAARSLAIETELKRALSREGLLLHYQPVVRVDDRSVVGVEALVRLRTDDGELLAPSRFIAIAEAAGLISRVGEWVALEACRQAMRWQEAGLPPCTISFNVSPLEFRNQHFPRQLERILAKTRIDSACVQIELTESAVMQNVDDAIAILHRLKALGIKIALDDFGTGYSSLSHLSNLPIDKLKVDQSFVRRIDDDAASRAIIEAIIALGRTLKLEVVGEGIESERALTYLHRHGCHQVQGNFISGPLSAEEFLRWYEKRAAG